MPDFSDEELDAIEPEIPEPTAMQSWLGRRSFIGRANETLDRPANLLRSALSSAAQSFSGDTRGAAETMKGGLKGVPGLVTGAVDLVGERVPFVNVPSLQDYVDEKIGFDPEADKTSGQQVLKDFGAIKKANNPLWSPQGAAGFAVEAVADPLHVGAISRPLMKPLKMLGTAAEKLVPAGFKRGPIEAASAAAERAASVIKKDALTEEALRRAEPSDLVTRELETINSKYGAPGNAREAQLRGGELKMGQNVGTGSLQITPDNERVFAEISQDPPRVHAVMQGINDLMVQMGKEPIDLTKVPTDQGVNRLKHLFDTSGLRPEKINDVLEAVTGARPIAEDAVTQARMRMFQHAHAVGLNKFSDDLIKERVATIAQVAPTNTHPTGKPDVDEFYTSPVNRAYVVRGLTYNGQPLIFGKIDDAVRAQQVYSYMRPDTVGKVSIQENILDVYDEFNRAYKYGVTQPFPQYAVMNRMTNRMNGRLAGDVPVLGSHYNIGSSIMGGGGYNQTFNVGKAGQLTGKQLVGLYQTHGAALPNINPALGKGLDPAGMPDIPVNQSHGAVRKAIDPYIKDIAEANGPNILSTTLKKGNAALQTVGKPMERVSAGMVGTMFNPTGMGPAALKGQVTNQMLEESDRFGIFIHGLMQGMDAGSALRKADIVLGNQSAAALTPLERAWAGRAMLFYNYTRNTIPIMAKAFTEKPGVFNIVLKADRQRKEQEPGYIQEGISIDLPGKGTTLSNIPNPIENVTKQFGADNPVALAAPLLKGAYENLSGDSTLTGRPLSPKAPNYMPASLTQNGETALPGLTELGMPSANQNQMLGNLPISRGLSLLNYAKKPETTLGDLGLNATTGMKVQRFEPESTSLYNEAEANRLILESYLKTGAIKKTKYGYTPVPAAFLKMNPEDVRKLRQAYGKYTAFMEKAGKVRKANTAK